MQKKLSEDKVCCPTFFIIVPPGRYFWEMDGFPRQGRKLKQAVPVYWHSLFV